MVYHTKQCIVKRQGGWCLQLCLLRSSVLRHSTSSPTGDVLGDDLRQQLPLLNASKSTHLYCASVISDYAGFTNCQGQSDACLQASAVAPETAAKADASSNKSLTQRIMESIPSEHQAGGAGAATTYQALQGADKAWERLRNMDTVNPGPAPQFVKESDVPFVADPQYDAVVCGGASVRSVIYRTQTVVNDLSVLTNRQGPLLVIDKAH